MSAATDKALVRAPLASSPPRHIDINPKSARTVVHEVYTHRRGSPAARGSMDESSLPNRRAGSYAQGDEANYGPGILPDSGTVARRRRSTIEGGDRYNRRFYDRDHETDSSKDYSSPRRHHSHRHHHRFHNHSPNRSSSPSTVSSSSHRRRHSTEVARYDPGLDITLHPPNSPSSGKHSSDDDSSDSDSDYDPEEHRKIRKSAMLYTGLAALTTLSAANGIYQNSKGFYIRQQAFKSAQTGRIGETKEEEEERRKARRNKLAMDAFALGVCGLGLNGVRVGWGRMEEKKRLQRECEQKAWEKGVRRKEREKERKKRERDGSKYSVEEP